MSDARDQKQCVHCKNWMAYPEPERAAYVEGSCIWIKNVPVPWWLSDNWGKISRTPTINGDDDASICPAFSERADK